MLYKFEYIRKNIIMYKRSNAIIPYLQTNKGTT